MTPPNSAYWAHFFAVYGTVYSKLTLTLILCSVCQAANSSTSRRSPCMQGDNEMKQQDKPIQTMTSSKTSALPKLKGEQSSLPLRWTHRALHRRQLQLAAGAQIAGEGAQHAS